MSNTLIREGNEGDIPALMQMILDLAEFEKAPHLVEMDEQRLFEDWSVHKAFRFVVAEQDSEIAGMSLFYPRYSTWQGRCYYLEDLYVKPEFRNRGVGLALLQAAADEARIAGAGRLDWQVLDWNKDAVRFYERLGAVVEKEWWNCKLKL